jgi:hypothetical protein
LVYNRSMHLTFFSSFLETQMAGTLRFHAKFNTHTSHKGLRLKCMRSVLPFKKCPIVQSSSHYTPFVIYKLRKVLLRHILISSKSQRHSYTITVLHKMDTCFKSQYTVDHGLINYIDIKAKCRHLKILTCKKTLRQVFIRVYRLDIQSVLSVFATQLFELLPLSPSLSVKWASYYVLERMLKMQFSMARKFTLQPLRSLPKNRHKRNLPFDMPCLEQTKQHRWGSIQGSLDF